MTITQEQCLLTYLGYDPGPIDGVDGPRTRAALAAFTADYGCGADGLAGAVGGIVAKKRKPPDGNQSEKATGSTGTFWDEIKYFTRDEFRCPCGHCSGFPAEPEEKLIRLADRTRSYFAAPVTVSSGVRCAAHNAEVGGVSNSRHLLGKAMDFSVRGFSAAQILAYVQHLKGIRYAYAIDGSYVHMDVE